eukprot:gene174-792_t
MAAGTCGDPRVFMAGPMRRHTHDAAKLEIKPVEFIDDYSPPRDADKPRSGSYTLFVFDEDDDFKQLNQIELDKKFLVIGSSPDKENQIVNFHKSVKKQHVAIVYCNKKLYLDPIDGDIIVHSILDFPQVHDVIDHTMPKEASNTLRFAGIDGKKALNRDKCCFKVGKSNRLYVVTGNLQPSKAMERERDRDRDRNRDRDRRRDRDRERDRRERSRSRSYRR